MGLSTYPLQTSISTNRDMVSARGFCEGTHFSALQPHIMLTHRPARDGFGAPCCNIKCKYLPSLMPTIKTEYIIWRKATLGPNVESAGTTGWHQTLGNKIKFRFLGWCLCDVSNWESGRQGLHVDEHVAKGGHISESLQQDQCPSRRTRMLKDFLYVSPQLLRQIKVFDAVLELLLIIWLN